MQTQLVVKGRVITVGDRCLITEKGNANGLGPINTVLSIWGFEDTETTTLVGMYSSVPLLGWGILVVTYYLDKDYGLDNQNL